MINKIKEWFFFKYGVEVEPKHIWMFLILLGSIALLLFIWMANSGSNKKLDPKNMPALPGMSGGVPRGQTPAAGTAPGASMGR